MKAVLDTNVLVSGILFGGIPGRIIDLWTEGRIEVFASPIIVAEYHRVLDVFLRQSGRPLSLIAALTEKCHIVSDSHQHLKICRDPDDDKFINCALAAGVTYIVSGDKDLLQVGRFGSVKVIKPALFLSLIKP